MNRCNDQSQAPGSLRKVKQGGGASMRRSLFKAKLKLSQLTSRIILFKLIQTSIACEESTLKVREKCVSFAYQERLLARARPSHKVGRSPPGERAQQERAENPRRGLHR
eukprot:6200461-Pleurochrysis_carterae.AAC.1